jgi:hypothetical protein
MHVGNKKGAKTPLRLVFTHQVTSHARAYQIPMTLP